jgi:dihydroorotate dehydrogenase
VDDGQVRSTFGRRGSAWDRDVGVSSVRGSQRFDPYAVAGPLLRLAPPELAHRIGIHALRCGLVPEESSRDEKILAVSRWGLKFPNPVGLAAGFDKNAEVADIFPSVGFVETGTVTPRPQSGNPVPRVFRLPEDRAVINRLGFNNEGMEAVRTRLARRSGRRIVGVNLGCNRGVEDPVQDYVNGLLTLGPLADYVTVNVSSPNTPGLRDLQGAEKLESLLAALLEARSNLRERERSLPILVKIPPDLDPPALQAFVSVALETGIEGIVVSNTTLSRPPSLKSRRRNENGGLSGEPLKALAKSVLRTVARLAARRLTLVRVGGIATGRDAYERIRLGASLVQLYTALIYDGPGLIGRIKSELVAELEEDGFASVEDAVGVDV